jgi:hypothetical protein
VTLLPTSPIEGLNVSTGVTVNVPAAETFPSAGVDALMTYAPAAEVGTVTVQVKEPSLTTSTGPSLHGADVPLK